MTIGEFIWGMGEILGTNSDILFKITCRQFYFNYFAIVVLINTAFKLFRIRV